MNTTKNQVFIFSSLESDFNAISKALNSKSDTEILIKVTYISNNIENVRFPSEANIAIVCTAKDVENLPSNTIKTFRDIIENRMCRIYIKGSISEGKFNPFDDFIQKIQNKPSSEDEEIDFICERVIDFFKENPAIIARKENLLNIRDKVCLNAFDIIKWPWDISNVVAGLVVIAMVYLHFFETIPLMAGFFNYIFVIGIATFLGIFYCVHRVVIIIRNLILATITSSKNPLLAYFVSKNKAVLYKRIFFYSVSVILVFYSIIKINYSYYGILISIGLSFFAFWLYMYSLKITAELAPLSELEKLDSDLDKKSRFVNTIGRIRIPTDKFPLVAKKSGVIFISNMHRSEDWSKKSAEILYDEVAKLNNRLIGGKKYEIFLDRMSIPTGGLWRKHLLRAIRGCSFFVVMLDEKYLDSKFVFVECAYAAKLRKIAAKPIILLVFKNKEGKEMIEKNVIYHPLFKDIFEIPEDLQLGAGILIADNKEVNLGMIIKALEKIEPMQLLVS